MLVLSRKPEEGIRIGNDVRILVTEIRGGKVRLGIEAPRDTLILREEIWVAICKRHEDGKKESGEEAA